VFIFAWRKKIGGKDVRKMLVKLTKSRLQKGIFPFLFSQYLFCFVVPHPSARPNASFISLTLFEFTFGIAANID
jgi:hypothetical protein